MGLMHKLIIHIPVSVLKMGQVVSSILIHSVGGEFGIGQFMVGKTGVL